MTSRVCRRFVPLLFAALVASTLSATAGEFRYFLHVTGIPGGVTEPGRETWIEAHSLSANVIATAHGSPLVSASVSKPIDGTSPKLLHACATQAALGDMRMEVVHAASGVTLYRLRLRDSFIIGVNEAADAKSTYEQLVIGFTAVEWIYSEPDTQHELATYYDSVSNTGNTGRLPAPTPAPGPDSDGDGIPDTYETANGLNPSLRDSDGDRDGDGATNRGEFIAGTRADNPRSVFRVTGTTMADGTMLVTWSSIAGKTYVILSAASPAGPWNIVESGIPSAGTGLTSRNVAASGARLFFKVETY